MTQKWYTPARIASVKKGIKAQGKLELLRYLENNMRLTQRQAILAHCYECMGFYSDGKQDCLVSDCPLYEYMPYRGLGKEDGSD
jgi:hypothetical protein